MKRFSLFLILFICFGKLVHALALPEVEENYFRSPVDIKLYLSGTFGEPRSTHFHTGIDIKTEGVEGKKIYAVADGYISRISVSPYGYGNALYVTHTNGMVSVYGHLQKFSSEIQAWTKQQQHELTNFAINLEDLDPKLFPVKQGDVIALSGNTGGSGGPHLHFELRDSLEHPLNPLLFGFEDWLSDQARPSIYNVFFYSLGEDRQFTAAKKLKPSLISSGNYAIQNPIKVNTQNLGIGIHTVDLFTGTSNKNGVYAIKLYDNNELIYHYQVDILSFDYTKHVYSHCDYWQKKNHNNTVHKCFVEKGNQLPTYKSVLNSEGITLNTQSEHQLRVEVSDFHGNTSTTRFRVIYDSTATFFQTTLEDYTSLFTAGERNYHRTENIRIDFGEEVFFNDLYFQYSERPHNAIGPYFDVHNKYTPVSTYFDISLRYDAIDSAYMDKYLIAYYDYKNRKQSIGGKIRGGFIHGETRALGTYFIDIDTIPPKVSALNISQGKTMTWQKSIQFKAYDDFSGIDEYNAFVNGLWVVLSYDAKRNLMSYHIDEFTQKGENLLEILVSDERGNVDYQSFTFNY